VKYTKHIWKTNNMDHKDFTLKIIILLLMRTFLGGYAMVEPKAIIRMKNLRSWPNVKREN
jgi:hypothetical protein